MNCLNNSSDRLIHRVKLFIPCNDAENNEYGKNSYRNQLALYIHVVKQGVEFFHNLNFVFKNGLDQVFKRGGDRSTRVEYNSKGVRRLKTERSNSYNSETFIRPLLLFY